jgi:ABC-type multidrug transport system fused ATPase/permease subunit
MQKEVSASETIKSDKFLPRIVRQGRNYSTIVGWLLHRAFSGRTSKLAVAVVLSLLHLGSQAAAIFVVYWYGKQMEHSGLVKVPFVDINVDLKTEPQWLWAIVAVATVCFIVSAVLLYLSRKQILDMVEKYYARSLEQLVLLSLRVPDPRVPLASRVFMDHGLGGLTMGCRRGSLTAITFANAITAVVGGLGAAAFLFRIDLSLTVVIVVTALLAAVFLYPLTLRAVKGARDREKAQAALRLEIRKLNEDPTVEQTATSLDTVDEVARTYMVRRRVLTELVFATEIGITILLGVVIYYMASQALAGREQWAIFIAYIGALRMTLYGAALAIRAFASVSRYYPQIVRYYLFIKDMQKLDQTTLAEVRRGDKVVLGTLANGEDVVVEAGDTVAMLAIGPIRDAAFSLVGAKLDRSGEPVGAVIVAPDNMRQSSAGVVLVSAQRPEQDGEKIRAFIASEALKDRVTLIVYTNAEKVGAFGESRVLTAEEGELLQLALLGTAAGDAALKECTQKAAKRAAKAGRAGEDEDEEDV